MCSFVLDDLKEAKAARSWTRNRVPEGSGDQAVLGQGTPAEALDRRCATRFPVVIPRIVLRDRGVARCSLRRA